MNESKKRKAARSACEYRLRKKLRFQYLEELVASRERAICALRAELEMLKQWCIQLDNGVVPPNCACYVASLKQKLVDMDIILPEQSTSNCETLAFPPLPFLSDLESVFGNILLPPTAW